MTRTQWFLAAFLAALLMSLTPGPVWATVDCNAVLAGGETGTDSDSDGFTDYQECAGITLADGVTFVPSCIASVSNPSPPAVRSACLDPNSKDLFVIYAPATSGSLLTSLPNPFTTLPAYNVTFNGVAGLGVTVHQITPSQAASDRTVTNLSLSTQRAVRVAESLDTNGTVLGYCQYGTPNGLDGCTVFTQRIINFIASTCGSAAIVTPAGAVSTIDDVFRAYAIHVILHELGHTMGGMTGSYNSSYGGNHYAAATSPGRNGAGTRMEQYVTYSVKSGNCKFFVPADWDASLDPPTVRLK